MKDDLARTLLSSVMGWSGAAEAEELLAIQMLARYKYDEYGRFEPGLKFVESLARWLYQFTPEERMSAYQFVRRRLIFVSDAQLSRLVETVYPDVIRPIIRRNVSDETGLPFYEIRKIQATDQFLRTSRRSLFLGMSDGSRIDDFRRNAGLGNEQVYGIYELEENRRRAMKSALARDLECEAASPDATFRLVFLIDDFSGSGRTLLRQEDAEFDGRLKRFADLLLDDRNGTNLFAEDVVVHVCLYIATDQAIRHLNELLPRFGDAPWRTQPEIHEVQRLGENCRIDPAQEVAFDEILKKYYDPDMLDEHTEKGGDSVMYGFANCALPLVLPHNTPNNSVYLLWKSYGNIVPLFPRVERHKVEVGG